jgi:hypothetical protein
MVRKLLVDSMLGMLPHVREIAQRSHGEEQNGSHSANDHEPKQHESPRNGDRDTVKA